MNAITEARGRALWRIVADPDQVPYYVTGLRLTRDQAINAALSYHSGLHGRASLVLATLKAQDRGRRQVILVEEKPS